MMGWNGDLLSRGGSGRVAKREQEGGLQTIYLRVEEDQGKEMQEESFQLYRMCSYI